MALEMWVTYSRIIGLVMTLDDSCFLHGTDHPDLKRTYINLQNDEANQSMLRGVGGWRLYPVARHCECAMGLH